MEFLSCDARLPRLSLPRLSLLLFCFWASLFVSISNFLSEAARLSLHLHRCCRSIICLKFAPSEKDILPARPFVCKSYIQPRQLGFEIIVQTPVQLNATQYNKPATNTTFIKLSVVFLLHICQSRAVSPLVTLEVKQLPFPRLFF